MSRSRFDDVPFHPYSKSTNFNGTSSSERSVAMATLSNLYKYSHLIYCSKDEKLVISLISHHYLSASPLPITRNEFAITDLGTQLETQEISIPVRGNPRPMLQANVQASTSWVPGELYPFFG